VGAQGDCLVANPSGSQPHGPAWLLQPIADAVKLIFKEVIIPTAANKSLFFLGPIMTIMPALAAWAVIPFGPEVAWPTSTPACCS